MKRFIIVSLALLLAVLVLPAQAELVTPARDWVHLNGKPLQNPFNPNVIRTVIHRFSILPGDVADELAQKIISERGRPSTLCKGATIAGMSFGASEVWNQSVRVVWANVREDCKPITAWETARGQTAYAVFRVHACRNLGVFFPRQDPASLPPSTGPILGLIPETACPPHGGQATCC